MKYDITVIVPIYNSAQYLEETLNSIVDQTIFEKLEIILINDGSTDKSKEISQKYIDKFSNIRLINQPNLGVSEARNLGLQNATGTYVTFMDSDDIIEKDLYEKELFEISSNNYDILIIDFVKKHKDGKIIKYRNNFRKEWNNSQDALKDFFKGIIGGQVVDKLFLRKIVKNIKFCKDYKIGEDMLFTYNAIKKSNSILIDTNICGYQYIVRDSSAMTGNFSEKYFDPIKVSKLMSDELKEDNLLFKFAQAHLIHESCKTVEYIYRHNAQVQYKNYTKKIIKEIRKYKISDAYLYLVRKQFLGFILIRISPKLYLFFHKIMHIG